MRVTYGRNRQLGFWWMALVSLGTEALKPAPEPGVNAPPPPPKVQPIVWVGVGLGALLLIGGLAVVLRKER